MGSSHYLSHYCHQYLLSKLSPPPWELHHLNYTLFPLPLFPLAFGYPPPLLIRPLGPATLPAEITAILNIPPDPRPPTVLV